MRISTSTRGSSGPAALLFSRSSLFSRSRRALRSIIASGGSGGRRRPAVLLAVLVACGLSGGAGCSSDDPRQIDTIQVVANALRARNVEAACALNVEALRSPVTCQGMIAQLVHYSPGFIGARVDRRGPSSGWRYSTIVRVPVRFTGPNGSGELDVALQRTRDGWRIAAMLPRPAG